MELYFFYLTYNFIYQLQNHFLGYQCPRYYHRYHSLFPVTSWYHMDSSNHIPTSWQHKSCWSHQYPSPSTFHCIDHYFFLCIFSLHLNFILWTTLTVIFLSFICFIQVCGGITTGVTSYQLYKCIATRRGNVQQGSQQWSVTYSNMGPTPMISVYLDEYSDSNCQTVCKVSICHAFVDHVC